MNFITTKIIEEFKEHLTNEEKSAATLEKYVRDVTAFSDWVGKQCVEKSLVLKYKQYIMENYAPSSVNSIISSLNSFFQFNNWFALKVKTLKIQRQIFASGKKELTKFEYERLLCSAKKKNNERLYLVMQTICSTGIRVSELKYITVDAVKNEQATIKCKGKMREVFIPGKLCKRLVKYIKAHGIESGAVFVTKNAKPLDRSNIWLDMKNLCSDAGVAKEKVFPHNLRHLFARTYYTIQRDIVRLADILGHTSINTTRIYTMETGEIHKKQIQMLGLLRC